MHPNTVINVHTELASLSINLCICCLQRQTLVTQALLAIRSCVYTELVALVPVGSTIWFQ